MLAIIVAAVSVTSKGDTQAETLQEALVDVYTSNPQLQAERAQLRATDDYMPEALANWRPTVAVTGQQGINHNAFRQDCGKVQPDVFGIADCSYKALNYFNNLWPQSYGLTITQPVYKGGTIPQTEQALDLIRSERATLVNTEQSVFMTAITDYLNVFLQETIVDLNVNNEQTLQKEVLTTQRRLKGGELTRTDEAQAEAALAQALSSRRQAEIQLAFYRAAYEHDVGRLPGKLIAPNDALVLPEKRADALQLAAVAAPSVVSAQYAQQAAEANVKAVAGQALPSLSVVASISRSKETMNQPGLRADNGQVVAQLNIPLYEGGAVTAQTNQAEQTVAVRWSELDDARRAAVQAAAQAWDQRDGQKDVIAYFQKQVRADEVAITGLKREASVGERTVYDILVQEQALLQARIGVAQGQHDEIVATFTLAQAIGQLTALSLGLPVDYYDPDQNFQAVRDPAWPLP